MPEQSTTTDLREWVVNWFRPDTSLPPSLSIRLVTAKKKGWADDDTAREVLSNCELQRAESLNWADRLDRKLLAVLTANGVYVAILATIRHTLYQLVIWPIGVLVLISIILAFLAWRPQGYQTIDTEDLLSYRKANIDKVRKHLISAHYRVNHKVAAVNMWKARKLKVATWFFFASATLLTIALLLAAGEQPAEQDLPAAESSIATCCEHQLSDDESTIAP